MGIYLFEKWKNEGVIAGYSTDFNGEFRYNHPEDWHHFDFVGQSFGLNAQRMVRLHQKHTDHVLVVTENHGGEGVVRDGCDEGCDALITDVKNMMLCVVTADCVPVFILDEQNGAIGLVHSGRRGTAKEIVRKTIGAMKKEYGSKPENLQCILGPYLCVDHHEVGIECVEEFYDLYSLPERNQFINKKNGRHYVDMGKAIQLSLIKEKVRIENIFDNHLCTYENPGLYSWRRDHRPDARILSFFALNSHV